VFIVATISGTLQAQGGTNAADVEIQKLKIQADERARQEGDQRDWETKIFPVRNVDANQLGNALSLFRASVQPNQALRVVSIRAPKEIMPAIEDAIKRLDVPSPRLEAELTIYVVMSSDASGTGTPIPPALTPVFNQLKGVLSYPGYRLVDTLITRGSARSSQYTTLSGTLMVSDSIRPLYNFQAMFQVEDSDGKTPVLRLNQMKFNLNVPGGLSGGLSGDVEIPKGQQVVVGKTTMGDRALILVMSARFD
jgi:hypothetical protein